MLGERTKPDEVELGLDELPRGRAAYRGPSSQGESEVFRERHRAEERARLKKHTEARHALVKVRLADAVDVDAPGLGPLESDQIPQQRALAAPRSAEDCKNRSALDLEGGVLQEYLRPPTYPQIVDGDVWP